MIRLLASSVCLSLWLLIGQISVGESSVIDRVGTSLHSGWVCQVDGKIYHEGDNFTIHSPCMVYQCRSGLTTVIKYGCYHENKCLSLGEQVEGNCIKQECVHENYSVGLKVIKYGCQSGSRCLDLGESYQDGCYTYACEKITVGNNDYYALNMKSWGCLYENRCFKENQIALSNCVTRRCEKRGFSIGMFDITEACKVGDKCYMINETYTENCKIYKCEKHQIDGMTYYGVELASVLCQDAEGHCHKSGELFSFGFNNQINQNCTCDIKGLSINYSCMAQ